MFLVAQRPPIGSKYCFPRQEGFETIDVSKYSKYKKLASVCSSRNVDERRKFHENYDVSHLPEFQELKERCAGKNVLLIDIYVPTDIFDKETAITSINYYYSHVFALRELLAAN